jgi:hypothetical protein
LRQSHLHHDGIRPARQHGIRQSGLPRVAMHITQNENETLSVSASQERAKIHGLIVHLDRRDADSPLGQRWCHSP